MTLNEDVSFLSTVVWPALTGTSTHSLPSSCLTPSASSSSSSSSSVDCRWQDTGNGTMALVRLSVHDATYLKGSLPDSLAELAHLTRLKIKDLPHVSGELPVKLPQTLTFLDMSSLPKVEGTIPLAWFSELTLLERLDVEQNEKLAGTLPTHFGQLTSLLYVDLDGLPLVHGSIPSELGNCVYLTRLSMKGTPFTGALPSTLGALTSLGKGCTLGGPVFTCPFPDLPSDCAKGLICKGDEGKLTTTARRTQPSSGHARSTAPRTSMARAPGSPEVPLPAPMPPAPGVATATTPTGSVVLSPMDMAEPSPVVHPHTSTTVPMVGGDSSAGLVAALVLSLGALAVCVVLLLLYVRKLRTRVRGHHFAMKEGGLVEETEL